MATKTWKIIPRPLLETILNNHAQHHRVPQPLILHGPAAPAKPPSFSNNKGPHITSYVDFAQSSIKIKKNAIFDKIFGSVLWVQEDFTLSARSNAQEIDGLPGLVDRGKSLSLEETSYFREAIVALRLAKKVIKVQQGDCSVYFH
uniref:Uncharacterized protein n=1 Tax=Manihot esculenta TaxID=3983 RepID=A0A2C9UNW8_MANES